MLFYGYVIATLVAVILLLYYMRDTDNVEEIKNNDKKNDIAPENAQKVIVGKEMLDAVWVRDGFGYVLNGRLADTQIEFIGCKYRAGRYYVEAKVSVAT